jgi:CRISPR-associated protein (TIGR03986 family)
MEKAKLELIKTKKGDFAVYIILENGKKIPLSDFKLRDDSLNNKEVEIIRENGRVVSMVCEGREIYSQKSSNDNRSYKQENKRMFGRNNPEKDKGFDSNKNRNIYSRAPYNFIPLNKTVVSAGKIPEFDRYYTEDRFTGYIDIEIGALTPLYIRDALTEEEYKEKLAKEKRDKTYINPDFFSPGGIPRIPGSSLRGMIRTMVEIMSFGKFGFFDDARLYYRGLADVSSLRKEYQRHMSSFDKNSKKTQYKMSAGFLHKKGFNYFITPAKGFKQILKKEARQMVEKIGEKYEDFKFYKINNGYIVVSGPMQNKKRDWFIDLPDANAQEFKIPEEDILNYKDDRNRSDKVPDLLKLSKDGVPCFYVRYKDSQGKDRISFGHTGMFRLAYEKTIGDHIAPELKNPNITDIAEAIFGNEKTHAGRVFFEDAYLDGEPGDALLETAIPKILSNPKQTCFQHYIEQKEENLKDYPKNLAHYNLENPIRGYKLYWHRSGSDYEAEEISYDEKEFSKLLTDFNKSKDDFIEYIIEEKGSKIKINLKNLPPELKAVIIKSIGKHENQHTLLKPVNKGAIFRGRIRFENLSEVELGALLSALDLPEGLAHKIGMGKPLGLGSVKITPKLYISDRKQRYSELLAEWNGLNDETNKITDFKNAFERYVLDELQDSDELQKTITSLWNIDRMQQLKTMLDWNNKPKDEKTDYLPLNKFRERKVLPKPLEVVEDENSPQS